LVSSTQLANLGPELLNLNGGFEAVEDKEESTPFVTFHHGSGTVLNEPIHILLLLVLEIKWVNEGKHKKTERTCDHILGWRWKISDSDNKWMAL
jgi:hypothetical protein